MANIVVAFILWLFGGWVGLHHFYLGRDRHAFVWWATWGGCFGLGWFRDLWRLSEYVCFANEDVRCINEFKSRMRYYPRPPFSVVRFTGELSLGFTFGLLICMAIPEEYVKETLWGWLLSVLVTPYGVAVGVHLVANIEREKASMYWPLIGAVCGLPWLLYDPQNIIFPTLFSAIFVNWKGKEWQKQRKPKRHICKRLATLTVCGCIYLFLWSAAIYLNASITTRDGEQVPVREAVNNFFNSPAWQETKDTLKLLYDYYKVHGWKTLWEEFVQALDPEGETHAYKVLGLESTATQKEITARYRSLAKEWHPDKQKDQEKKQEAQEKFIEIQKAYDRLSEIKSKRYKKNEQSRRDSHTEF